MTEEGLGSELVRQDGLSSPQRLEGEWRELQRLLEVDRKRASTVKWLAVGFLIVGAGSWAIALFTFVIAAYDPPPVRFIGELTTEGLPIIGSWSLALGIATGILGFFFSRTVDTRAMQVRLASIEMQLRSEPTPDR